MIPTIDLTHLTWENKNQGGSAGMLPKDDFDVKGIKYYVKMSSYSKIHGVYGLEAISEVIVSRLAKILGIPCVEYKLYNAKVKKDGKIYYTYLCISRDFKQGQETVAFEDAYEQLKMESESPLQFAVRTGNIDITYAMFLLDYVVNNMDRHGANIELFRTSLKFVPLFDHGNSLYATTDEERIKGTYYGDNMSVNNFIGSRSLVENLKQIDRQIVINALSKKDRAILFKDLGNVISRNRRDTIWSHIVRRYSNARKICNIREIKR